MRHGHLFQHHAHHIIQICPLHRFYYGQHVTAWINHKTLPRIYQLVQNPGCRDYNHYAEENTNLHQLCEGYRHQQKLSVIRLQIHPSWACGIRYIPSNQWQTHSIRTTKNANTKLHLTFLCQQSRLDSVFRTELIRWFCTESWLVSIQQTVCATYSTACTVPTHCADTVHWYSRHVRRRVVRPSIS